MIARHEGQDGRAADLWAKLAAPVPSSIVQWRQQGRPKSREGKFYAPFVAYIDAQFVRERLDAVVPGEWDLHLELLPSLVANGDGEAVDEPVAFKSRLQIVDNIREDVGTGRDYKTAATDAFKRAAVRFGIGHELYQDYEIIWVQVDGDGKFAKPLEDPAQVWARKRSGGTAPAGEARSTVRPEVVTTPAVATPPVEGQPAPATDGEPSCPKCGGRMWDNRVGKRNPKAPDYKCRNRQCDGVIWPAKERRAKAKADVEPVEYGHLPELDEEIPF